MLTTSIRFSQAIRKSANFRGLVERMSPRSAYIGRHRRRASAPAQISRVTALICRRSVNPQVNEIQLTQEIPVISDSSDPPIDSGGPRRKVLGYY